MEVKSRVQKRMLCTQQINCSSLSINIPYCYYPVLNICGSFYLGGTGWEAWEHLWKNLLFFSSSIFKEILRILILIGQILFSLAAVFLLCLVIKTYLIGPYYRKLHTESKGNKEILILGITAFIFLMLTVILEINKPFSIM